MADTSAIEKKAKRALKKAHKAVADARKATHKAHKKLRNQAEDLQKKADKLAKKHQNAVTSITEKPVSVKTTLVTTGNPQPQKVAAAAKASAVVTPPLPHAQRSTPTLIQLREQAKSKKISGYSRLNKAELIAALG